MFERMDEDFCLVQPRGVGWRIPRLPPATTFGEIASCAGGNVTGATVLDQEDAAQLLVLAAKQFQLGAIVRSVVTRQECQFHQAAMHYQEHQHVYRSVPDVVELLLFDRPWDCPADRLPLQNLKGRDLI